MGCAWGHVHARAYIFAKVAFFCRSLLSLGSFSKENLTSGKTGRPSKSIEREDRSLPLVFSTMPSLEGSAAACCSGKYAVREPENDQHDGDWFEIGGEDNYSTVPAEGAAASVAAAASAPAESRGVPAFNFSFAMGGWLMFYSFGVAKCLMDHGLHKVLPMRQRAIGSSAGSLAATALVLEADIDKVRLCVDHIIFASYRRSTTRGLGDISYPVEMLQWQFFNLFVDNDEAFGPMYCSSSLLFFWSPVLPGRPR